MTYTDDEAPPRRDELGPLAGDVMHEVDMFLWAAEQLLGGAAAGNHWMNRPGNGGQSVHETRGGSHCAA